MRLVHVTPYFAPAWAYGGVARAVTELARAQTAAGHAVTVLTTDALAPHERLAAGETVVDGIRVWRARNVSGAARTWLNLSTPSGLRRMARQALASGVDVVHLHELRTVENLLVVDAVPPAVPVIVSPHGTLRHDTGRGWAKRAWDGLVGDPLLARVDRVVALSPSEAEEARQCWAARGLALGADRVAVVPNGVDLSAFAALPPRHEARSRFGLGDGPVVLFFGRLTPRKGLTLLLDAFARIAGAHPAAQVLIAGPDHGAGKPAEAHARALGLEAQVRFAGFLSGDARLAAYAAADLFVLPAVGEGLPLAALEALACGVPALLSPDCHLDEVAAGGAGDVVPLEADAWAAALGRRLTAVERGDDGDARASARRLADRYTWAAVAHRMDTVYADAIARRGR